MTTVPAARSPGRWLRVVRATLIRLGEVEKRRSVERPHKVADRAGGEVDGGPESRITRRCVKRLPGVRPAAREFEGDRVEEPDGEAAHDEHDPEHAARAPGAGHEHEDEHEHGLQHEVDRPGDEARADAGERNLQRHSLRGAQGDLIVQIHGSVNLNTFIRERSPDWAALERDAAAQPGAPRAPRSARRAGVRTPLPGGGRGPGHRAPAGFRATRCSVAWPR